MIETTTKKSVFVIVWRKWVRSSRNAVSSWLIEFFWRLLRKTYKSWLVSLYTNLFTFTVFALKKYVLLLHFNLVLIILHWWKNSLIVKLDNLMVDWRAFVEFRFTVVLVPKHAFALELLKIDEIIIIQMLKLY